MPDIICNREVVKNKTRKHRLLKRILIILVAFFLVSMIINLVMLKVENAKYQPPGKLINIEGHKMHIYGAGQGTPTVVMTCGSGTPSAYTDYSLIQPEISEITRVCIYERPGYGWSEDASTPRNTDQIVSDLKSLLEKAGEYPPYLFVAHSMGAMEVLAFSEKYPEQVAGIVLIDGTSPLKHIKDTEASISKTGVKVLRIMNKIGFIRIATELKLVPLLNDRINYMVNDNKDIEKFMLYKNFLNDMVIKEGDSITESAQKMYEKINLDNLPLVLVTADTSLKELPFWDESQQSLLKLSTDSKQIIVKDASHVSINQKHADIIVTTIKELINKIKLDNKGEN